MTTISFELGVKSLIMTKDVLLLYRVAEIQDMDSSMKHNKNCLLILQDEIQLYTVHVFVNLGSRFFYQNPYMTHRVPALDKDNFLIIQRLHHHE